MLGKEKLCARASFRKHPSSLGFPHAHNGRGVIIYVSPGLGWIWADQIINMGMTPQGIAAAVTAATHRAPLSSPGFPQPLNPGIQPTASGMSPQSPHSRGGCCAFLLELGVLASRLYGLGSDSHQSPAQGFCSPVPPQLEAALVQRDLFPLSLFPGLLSRGAWMGITGNGSGRGAFPPQGFFFLKLELQP